MIANVPNEHLQYLFLDMVPGLIGAALFFCLGVGFAAYRAVGWVERMRAWAHGVEVQAASASDRDTIAGALVDERGNN